MGDTHDVALLRSVIASRGVTAVMHFAAWPAVGESVRDPAGYYRNNVEGTLSVLRGDGRGGRAAFIFSSTCAVYGEPSEVPISESHPTAADQRLRRDEARRRARAAALRAGVRHPLDRAAVLQRRRRRPGRASSARITHPEIHLIPLAHRGGDGRRPLQVFGDDYPTPDGTCLRDYIHVTDLADAHLRALDALERGARVRRLQPGQRARRTRCAR